jgi:protein SCO1/2
MRLHRRLCPAGLAFAIAAALPAQEGMPASSTVQVRQEASSMLDRIGAVVPGELRFTDELDRPLQLRQYFPGDRPVLLNLGYYSCPSMCGQVMEGMVEALNRVDLEPGQDYQILTVSIDPRETPVLAKERKDRFLAKLNRVGGESGWRFCVGEQQAITALTQAVGFRFFWAEHDHRFDHPPALVFLSPEGRVTRVLQGTTFDPRDVRLALVEASQGRLGTFLERVQLSCLTFDPVTRSYALKAVTVIKVFGAVCMLAVAAMVIVMLRRERRAATAT